MDAKPNVVKGTTDWNKKPDAGYLNTMGQPKRVDFVTSLSTKEINKAPPFSINKPPTHYETRIQPKAIDGPQLPFEKKKTIEMSGEDPKEVIKEMAPLSLSQSGSLMRNSFTHQIPSLTLRSYYKDSKLFEVMQAGILQVGLTK